MAKNNTLYFVSMILVLYNSYINKFKKTTYRL